MNQIWFDPDNLIPYENKILVVFKSHYSDGFVSSPIEINSAFDIDGDEWFEEVLKWRYKDEKLNQSAINSGINIFNE